MYIKLALSTAVLGTAAVAFAGYANTSVSTSSQALSDTYAQKCSALVDAGTTTTFDINEQIAILSGESSSNRLLALRAICNGYGYGGNWGVEADLLVPNRPTAAAPQAITTKESDAFVYFNDRLIDKTPQAATQFDQLPQDRIELIAPL